MQRMSLAAPDNARLRLAGALVKLIHGDDLTERNEAIEERAAHLGGRESHQLKVYQSRIMQPVTGGRVRNAIRDVTDVVRELWEYRELLFQLSLRDIRIRYKQAVMGFAWAIFMPGLIVLAGLMVKYIMARLAGTELQTESIGAVAVKSIPWAFFVGSLGFATNSLVGNKSLVSKIYFPREVFPIGSTLAQVFDTSIGLLALMAVLPFLGAQLSLALLWIPLLALLLFVMAVGAGLFVACSNLFFRDVKYIVQVLLTFGIFFTPVFFEPQDLGALGAQWIYLNPLAPILEGFRLTVIEAHNLAVPLAVTGSAGETMAVWSPWYLAYSALWAFGGLVFSSLLFHRLEFVFAEYA